MTRLERAGSVIGYFAASSSSISMPSPGLPLAHIYPLRTSGVPGNTSFSRSVWYGTRFLDAEIPHIQVKHELGGVTYGRDIRGTVPSGADVEGFAECC